MEPKKTIRGKRVRQRRLENRMNEKKKKKRKEKEKVSLEKLDGCVMAYCGLAPDAYLTILETLKIVHICISKFSILILKFEFFRFLNFDHFSNSLLALHIHTPIL